MRKLGAQRKILCAAPAYLERRGCPVSLADLRRMKPCSIGVMVSRFLSLRDVTGHMVEPKLTGRFQFDNQEAIADAALRGAGLAWLPAWLVQSYLLEGRLVEVLGEVGSIPIDTYAIWPSSRFVPMCLRMAIDALAMQFRRVVEGS
jgi:DNA-binding transcriptional LysR family regulator